MAVKSPLYYQVKQLVDEGVRTGEIAERLQVPLRKVKHMINRHHLRGLLPRGGPKGALNGAWGKDWVNGGVPVPGGWHQDKDGYWLVRFAGHPVHNRDGYVLEHILVTESFLGRLLLPNEVVHHDNGNCADNRPENLTVFRSNAEHLRYELQGRIPAWSDEGIAKLCLPKDEQRCAPLVDNYSYGERAGEHHSSGFANHPLLGQQCSTVQELARLHF